MTTTAFDDQFAPEPVAPVRERYDTATILRRNIADLEIALRKQVELAEAAEAELLAVREDNHSMMLEIDGLRKELAAQQAASAPSVPEEWREVMAELAADLQSACDAEHPHRDQYPSVMRKYNNDMEIVEKARALLQSADHSERNLEKVAPDCRNCANRGRVNGLSQESYCDGCVYQGRSWRKNHFVLAVKRRCEACAILPCSCK
jgi:hypothetical protein